MNEKINETLEAIIKEVERKLANAEACLKDPNKQDLADYLKGEAYAYEYVYGLLQDHLIDDDNL